MGIFKVGEGDRRPGEVVQERARERSLIK